MKYKVLKPIAWSGRREKGEIVEMPEEEAKNIGAEFLAPVEDEIDKPSASKEGAPESESVTTDEEKVEDEASRPAQKKKGKNKK
ncbi:MAG: hypothetical protein WC445_01210 [Patescibacteria group bacterium]